MLGAETNSNQSQKDFFKTPGFYVVLIVILLIVLGSYFIWKNKSKTPKKEGPQTEQQSKVQISEKQYFDPQIGTPPGFPTGLPLEKPLDIVDNSERTITVPETTNSPDIKYRELTVEYISDSTIETSVAAHRDYFRSRGWTIVSDSEGPQAHTIGATKARHTLGYTYSTNSISQKNYIKLIYSTPALSDSQQKLLEELQNTNAQ